MLSGSHLFCLEIGYPLTSFSSCNTLNLLFHSISGECADIVNLNDTAAVNATDSDDEDGIGRYANINLSLTSH